jgi:hypothetical protein
VDLLRRAGRFGGQHRGVHAAHILHLPEVGPVAGGQTRVDDMLLHLVEERHVAQRFMFSDR